MGPRREWKFTNAIKEVRAGSGVSRLLRSERRTRVPSGGFSHPGLPPRLLPPSQDHGKPIYGIAFNQFDVRHKDVFATVGGNRATVYEASRFGHVTVLQAFSDADRLLSQRAVPVRAGERMGAIARFLYLCFFFLQCARR